MYASPLFKTYLHFFTYEWNTISMLYYRIPGLVFKYVVHINMISTFILHLSYTISQIVFIPTVSKVVLSEYCLNVYKCRQKSIPNYKSMSVLRDIIVIFVIRITKICT